MNFRVGQKVVCIRDDWHDRASKFIRPVCGTIYTVRNKHLSPWSACPVGIRLFEIVNAEDQFDEGIAEPAWDASYFRPLVERKTDISVFTKMLGPSQIEKAREAV